MDDCTIGTNVADARRDTDAAAIRLMPNVDVRVGVPGLIGRDELTIDGGDENDRRARPGVVGVLGDIIVALRYAAGTMVTGGRIGVVRCCGDSIDCDDANGGGGGWNGGRCTIDDDDDAATWNSGTGMVSLMPSGSMLANDANDGLLESADESIDDGSDVMLDGSAVIDAACVGG